MSMKRGTVCLLGDQTIYISIHLICIYLYLSVSAKASSDKAPHYRNRMKQAIPMGLAYGIGSIELAPKRLKPERLAMLTRFIPDRQSPIKPEPAYTRSPAFWLSTWSTTP